MCVSWNGPGSKIADNNCNMHCSTLGRRPDRGETAAVIRKGRVQCGPPPPPPPPPPAPPVPLPAWWLAREAGADMYIAGDEPLLIGNGYAAAMFRTHTMHVAGVFSGDLDGGREPVRADMPSFWDGAAVEGYLGDFAEAIDVGSSAVFTVGALRGGGTLETRRYAHRSMPHVLVMDFTFNASGGTAVRSNISAVPGSWGAPGNRIATATSVWDRAPASGVCWNGTAVQSEDRTLPATRLALCTEAAVPNVEVPPGEARTYSVVAALYTSLDAAAPLPLAARQLAEARTLTAEQRWAMHVDAVAGALASGIEVRGNHELAKLVNASMHTLVAALRPEPEYWYSTSPGGLATDCYNGHAFWDVETWMFPNLLLFNPELAAGLVGYRVRGLPWAEAWAAATGRVGARYPWQTAMSGKVASKANEEEIHIVADVCLALWQYYAATHDDAWLRSDGLPVLRAAASFFAAWAGANPDGTYSLNATQGPDEFHTGNDSCYVNAGAAFTLRAAAQLSARVGGAAPGANWSAIAERVRMPFDERRQMHLEFAGWNDLMKAKQADTIMLAYPLGVAVPPQVRKNDLDYYAKHTGNGPSMTWSMYTVGYLEVGDVEQGAAFFNRSWLPYVDRKTGDFGGDCGGNFLTGAGGFLQGLWAGWAGIRLRLDSLDFLTPRVPATTDGMRLRGVRYLGHGFDVELNQGGTCFVGRAGGGGKALMIGELGKPPARPLGVGGPVCFEPGKSVRISGRG